jgi:hypothetical protein
MSAFSADSARNRASHDFDAASTFIISFSPFITTSRKMRTFSIACKPPEFAKAGARGSISLLEKYQSKYQMAHHINNTKQ